MSEQAQRRFLTMAWGALVYTLFVIAWGAFVRATGSGAGCGDHWPLCNGQVIPRAPELETIIEFGHRLTSGLALVAVIVVLVLARRLYVAGHPVRRWAWAAVVLMIVEALIGAGLVLFELVADDLSVARGLAMALHLCNTFLLLGAMLLVIWAARRAPFRLVPGAGRRMVWLLVATGGLMAVGASGAIAALGDTLFPGVRSPGAELSAGAHLLLRLRLLHPLLAVLVGAGLAVLAGALALGQARPEVRRGARDLALLVALQLAAGLVNVLLMAPVWLQLVHLLLADLLWLRFVWLGADALYVRAPGDGHAAGSAGG